VKQQCCPLDSGRSVRPVVQKMGVGVVAGEEAGAGAIIHIRSKRRSKLKKKLCGLNNGFYAGSCI